MKTAHKTQLKPGVTMLFVLMFMIVASMLGSSLVYVSAKQSDSTADFFAKKTANEAAESALDWFVGSIEDYTLLNASNSGNVMSWMNDFENSDESNRWFQNQSIINDLSISNITTNFSADTEELGSYIDMGDGTGKIKAKLRIENIDRTNNIIVVKSIGYGVSDSKKTIRGVYKLHGVQSSVTSKTTPKNILKHSFYSKNQVNFDDGFTADKDVYVGGLAELKSRVLVDGNLKIMGDENSLTLIEGDSLSKITGNIYIGGKSKLNAATEIGSSSDGYVWFDNATEINGLRGQASTFNSRTYFMDGLSGDNDYIFNEYMYHQGDFAESALFNGEYIDINGNILSVDDKIVSNSATVRISGQNTGLNDDYNDHRGEVTIKDNGTVLSGEYLEVPTKESILEEEDYEAEQTVDINLNLLRDKVNSNTDAGFRTSLFMENKLTAEIINDIYKGRRGIPGTGEIFNSSNDVLTIVVDDASKLENLGSEDVLDAGVNVAFVIDDNFSRDVKNWYGSTKGTTPAKSSTCGVFFGNGNIHKETIFNDVRGVIHMGDKDFGKYKDVNEDGTYNDGDQAYGVYNDISVDGAFIAKGEVTDCKASGTFTYNNDAINVFYQMGLFLNEDQTEYVIDDVDTSDEDSVVETKVATILKPILISKY